ncbi:MAG: hypothetical protein ACR2OR_12040 [Hyphomicrobiales bacterium]
MFLNLAVWLIGLLISAIPIVIVFATYLVPDSSVSSTMTTLDMARQAYPNILFVVIAVSGIAIAEAIIVFFRMVETGQQRATSALWLLCAILLIVYGAIAFGKVAGSSFVPAAISGTQISMAFFAAIVALIAALSLRLSMLRLELVARQQIHDEVAAAPIDLTVDRTPEYQEIEEDPYDLTGLRAAREATEAQAEEEEVPSEEPKPRRAAAKPAGGKRKS